MLRSLLYRCAIASAAASVASALGAQSTPNSAPGWEFRPAAPATTPMRVLVVYDMEGLAGVERFEMTYCITDSAAYLRGREQLIADVNAVIDGLVAGGASEIRVRDMHGSGCDDVPDLPANRLHPKASYEAASPDGPSAYGAVFLVGMHASPGTGGFLEHTMTFGYETILNGRSVTETELYALQWGAIGSTPVIFATGDDRLGAELRERLPWIVFVQTKRATSRTSAELRPVAEARAEMRAKARVALEQRATMKVPVLVAPFTGGFRPVWPVTLESLSGLPGLVVDNGMIVVKGGSRNEVNRQLRALQRVALDASRVRSSRIAARTRPDLKRVADSVWLAQWLAGPPASARIPTYTDDEFRGAACSGRPRLGCGLGLDQFARIPAGTFQMGSNTAPPVEGPMHSVTISRAFSMQKTEVTQAQWRAVMGTNPSFHAACGDTCPVDQVSWYDVQTFLQKLNASSPGVTYRLPTEGEWEYAARAGTTGDLYGPLDSIAWYGANSDGKLHPVAGKRANAWGLYDMIGNQMEWVSDGYGPYASAAATDPSGPAIEGNRVFRGAPTVVAPGNSVRATLRLMGEPSIVYKYLGFRLVRNP